MKRAKSTENRQIFLRNVRVEHMVGVRAPVAPGLGGHRCANEDLAPFCEGCSPSELAIPTELSDHGVMHHLPFSGLFP